MDESKCSDCISHGVAYLVPQLNLIWSQRMKTILIIITSTVCLYSLCSPLVVLGTEGKWPKCVELITTLGWKTRVFMTIFFASLACVAYIQEFTRNGSTQIGQSQIMLKLPCEEKQHRTLWITSQSSFYVGLSPQSREQTISRFVIKLVPGSLYTLLAHRYLVP